MDTKKLIATVAGIIGATAVVATLAVSVSSCVSAQGRRDTTVKMQCIAHGGTWYYDNCVNPRP